MKSSFAIINDIIKGSSLVFRSKYKWMLLFFLLWVFRVSCIPADASGFAKGLQIVTTFGLLYYAIRIGKNSISSGLFKTNGPNVTMTWYLILALVSTTWSYVPMMTFFMALEKLTYMIVLYAVFTKFNTFQNAERMFVFLMVGMIVFNGIATRVMGYQQFIGHDLQQGSCAAMCFSYCIGEYLAKKTHNKERYEMFKGAILISIFFLVISTSGGANASAVFGFCVALLVCGKVSWGLLLLLMSVIFLIFTELREDIFKFIMAGKSEGEIRTSTGRTSIWKIVEELGKQKPLLGWGHAAMERYITDKGYMPLTDLHSNFYGAYGSLGYIGLSLLLVHHAVAALFSFLRRMKPGYTGLLCAICCGTLNGYSYGYLAGKTAIITVVYIAVIMMTFIYSKVKFIK